MAADKTSGLGSVAKGLATMAGKRVLSSATERIGAATQRLTDYSDNGGGPGLLGALTGKGGSKGEGGKGKSLKVTNIMETVTVGVPVRVAYDQWTRFTEFPTFMKKVEAVEQLEDTKLSWKAQIFLSHRTWESEIIEQVPDRRIVWRSEGPKGTVDGAVTFHDLGENLTRITMVLEYHPQGFFEHTANLWRAQGRRARLELKHFARHVMTQAILHPEDVKGWRGEIHDGQVTKSPDEQEDQADEQEGRTDGGRAREQQSDEQRHARSPDEDGRRPERPRRSPAPSEESTRGPVRRRDPVRARSTGRQ